MTVYTYEHFMRLGKQHNCNAEIRSAYLELNFYPQPREGEYVLVCDECGQASFTNDINKTFCSQYCRRIHNARMLNPQLTLTQHFDHYEIIPEHPTTKPPMGIVHRYCEHCGKRFAVYAHHVRQGKKLYCSRTCSKQNRCLKPLVYTCNNCGEEFRAVSAINALFCSIECKQNFSSLNNISQIPVIMLKNKDSEIFVQESNFSKLKIKKEAIKTEKNLKGGESTVGENVNKPFVNSRFAAKNFLENQDILLNDVRKFNRGKNGRIEKSEDFK